MEAARFLRSLRAVRRFSAEPILDVARWTGSSKNQQPWEFVVVRNAEILRQLATLGHYAGHLAGARVAVVVVSQGGAAGAEFDAGRVTQNIMLAAWGFGVGSCIASLYPAENARRAKDLLGVPPERAVETAISLGYPADAAARTPRGSPPAIRGVVPRGRKSLGDLVSWEHYGRREA